MILYPDVDVYTKTSKSTENTPKNAKTANTKVHKSRGALGAGTRGSGVPTLFHVLF